MCVSWIDVLSEAKVLTPCHESKLHGKTPMSNLDEKDKKLDLSRHKWSQDVTRHMLSIFTIFRFVGLLQGLPTGSSA
jgi:hypothetical protein